MKSTGCFLSFLLLLGSQSFSQDSIQGLKEVIIKGFEARVAVLDVPASISTLRQRDLQRYANISLVPVMNTAPGVRMEERSPGSYRLSIRGSLLRSPFGVRNVKLYWDDVMLTDPGGNTYLNLIDFNGVGSVEILKGPGGSVFGAGTGGVVTLKEPEWTAGPRHRFLAQLNGGSFGTFGAGVKWTGGTENFNWQLLQSHQQSESYRKNSRIRRDYSQGTVNWKTGVKNQLKAILIYGDLGYRTPGGLTRAQMEQDPTQARPATPVFPSAEEQKAGVYNSTILAGVTNTYRLNEEWTNVTTVLASGTKFENPFISNYEVRYEKNFGLRSKFMYLKQFGDISVSWIIGGEFQSGISRIDSTGNNKGVPDGNLVRDRVRSTQGFLFTQLDLQLAGGLVVQAGASMNDFGYRLERTIPSSPSFRQNFDLQFLPRIGLLYKVSDDISLHASASRGYSAPGLAEIRPSAGGIYSDLQAEYGWSYEAGVKGSWWGSRLNTDLTAFRFDLKDAIVRRTNAAGAEYFVNAGGTVQKGLEVFFEAFLVNRQKGIVKQLRAWNSSTLYDFKFSDYKVNNTDHSGNRLTGVPSKVVVTGVDLVFPRGIYLNLTMNYTADLPLNDANDEYAPAYRLWQTRVGWKKNWKGGQDTELFAGVDNVADELYSLGNDINAFGRRFYNPAPGRNYFMGLRVSF